VSGMKKFGDGVSVRNQCVGFGVSVKTETFWRRFVSED